MTGEEGISIRKLRVVKKTNYAMAKLLSYDCRYLDDICTVHLKYFIDIDICTYIYIYDSTLLLEGSACSYKQETFVDLYICVVDGKLVTGIESWWFQFWSNQLSLSRKQYSFHVALYNIYSQLIRIFRLCNNINDFLFQAKLSYSKLVKSG